MATAAQDTTPASSGLGDATAGRELTDATSTTPWSDATAPTSIGDALGGDTTGSLPWSGNAGQSLPVTAPAEAPPLPDYPRYVVEDPITPPGPPPRRPAPRRQPRPQTRVPSTRIERPRQPDRTVVTTASSSSLPEWARGSGPIPQPGVRRSAPPSAQTRRGQTRAEMRQEMRQNYRRAERPASRKSGVGSAIWTLIVLLFVILWIVGSIVGH